MKLLIITQVIDTKHPILGFFHRWVAEFAVHCEHVHVIALQVGNYDLPANVTVYSLGKERGTGRLGYLLRFFRLIISLRCEYDNVFVHMNQIYVILGAPLWRLWGKRVGLWYMHGAVPVSLRLAERFTNHIFTGSAESFRIKSRKVIVTGHGIDVLRFNPSPTPTRDISLITVGRITPAKNLFTLLEILVQVRRTHPATLTIVGSANTPLEQAYQSELQIFARTHGIEDAVLWAGRVTQSELPALLARARVFVTSAQNGSLDKAILESMALGLPVVSLAPGSRALPLGSAQCTTKEAAAAKIVEYLDTTTCYIPEYVAFVAKEHSLERLIPKILTKLTDPVVLPQVNPK